MTIDNTDDLKKKIQIFKDSFLKVHLVLKDGEWLNGFIGDISSDFFMFKDKVKDELPIFYSELSRVEKYYDKKKEGVKE